MHEEAVRAKWGSQSWLQPAFKPAIAECERLRLSRESRLKRRLRARLPAPQIKEIH